MSGNGTISTEKYFKAVEEINKCIFALYENVENRPERIKTTAEMLAHGLEISLSILKKFCEVD